jgi:hypothetical protein
MCGCFSMLYVQVHDWCFMQIALAVGDDQLRPELPPATHPDLAAIAMSCFDSDPLGRPSFGLIVSQLTHVIQKVGTGTSPAQQRAATQQPDGNGMFSKLMKARPASLLSSFSAQGTGGQ